jgi:4-amino-4-deoxy-L-arabinose transferase-like glycosyltransferase
VYLGTSPFVDFAVCAGLGTATAACLIAMVFGTRVICATFASAVAQATLGVLLFVGFGGAMLAIALVIGETKPVRDTDSILGYVVGIALTLPLILRSFRNERAP